MDRSGSNESATPGELARRRFLSDRLAVGGAVLVGLLLLLALLAPLLANGRPFFIYDGLTREWRMPFMRYLFAPDTSETLIEQVFNFFLLFLPVWLVLRLSLRRCARPVRRGVYLIAAGLLAVPFFLVGPKLDKTDFRELAAGLPPGSVAVFAPIPFGPYELAAKPYAKPDALHIFGADQAGRDVASRMLYGGRVSLAVGLGATLLAVAVGTLVGLCCGYFGGLTDLAVMRVAEIMICFPTFLLLLILISLFQDWKFQQSILVVIAVIGLTGWIGICQLVRGETLRQRSQTYIQSCVSAGIPSGRILFVHLLPNIVAPVLISFTFSVAGAILAESTLSFLGFGVQPPTASWGGLLRQAYDNPFQYWHLTLIPGAALFLAVCAFNFTGEGLRLMFDPKSGGD